MTPATFARYCKLLYGPHYKRAAAEALGVDESTVWRWATKRSPIPNGIAEQLRHELRLMRDEIERILAA